MGRNFFLASAVGIALLSGPVRAYDLSDHATIVAVAVRELDQCFPGTISDGERDLLIHADRMEDLNLFEKELGHSHFYSPAEDFEQFFRRNSRARIESLQSEIDDEACGDDRKALLEDLGHAIHHIQDMTCPPHVMPINHGFRDGFERFPVRDIPPSTSCGLSADDSRTLTEIHQETARKTYRRVVDGVFETAVGQNVSWLEFWEPGTGGKFGHYGKAGNSFGQEKVSVRRTEVAVSPSVYGSFKKGQMREAINATKLALYSVLIAQRSRCSTRVQCTVRSATPIGLRRTLRDVLETWGLTLF